MRTRFRFSGEQASFFARDGSGVATRCEQSGETHFLHIDPAGFSELLSSPDFGINDLLEILKLSDENEAEQFAEKLLSLGIIDTIG
ncbi:MAG: hypothetical protein R3F50_00845 [Gammaproteobacteria bacterium]|jgi:hypothetical protein